MTTVEKQIEEAAKEAFNDKPIKLITEQAFIAGAKSQAAKEYWLQKLSEEYESKSDDSYIKLIEIINNVLKSDMAKEYHTKGMYSEEEVFSLLSEFHGDAGMALNNGKLLPNPRRWLDQRKKK